ncbi:hypothetical protein A2955_02430 [Candidatus Woesebacteria bacterium RIFCSPLOWO2_01_FULL_37_19]|uniref:Uncharacterized protein n=2 Tax=Candidatus Woeseibacteriota TaxID=1752722 RepID=A0A1F8AYK7_9BACT|nr:MAG: hypothetical protein A2771_00505 [Candidatus Woesebacteria bacterium RIFCSPHIGHO2_01_FULL_38_26b]OGM56589.1 MAG: hypothetical protein A2955_02430 [Candidatus Woesebacteria bacterium RIFCSPLOWO2_01_FULL_37_19]
MKKLKVFVFTIYTLFFVCLIGLEIYWQIINSSISVLSLIYWMILAGLLTIIIEKKFRSEVSFSWAFGLFFISAALAVLGLNFIAEIIMKISFIGWMIGITQALIEYKRLNLSD